MENKIRAGMRVLYKQNGQWHVGELAQAAAYVDKGLYLPVIQKENLYTSTDHIMIEINDLFLDAFPIEDWIKDYSEYFMTKEDYIKFIENDEFDKRLENAYVSDGEYGYYPINKYNANWIMKQPFNYIVRGT